MKTRIQQINGQRSCVDHHAFIRLALRSVVRRNEVFDLDIIQRSIFIDNTRSPLPLLGDRGSGSFQSLGELICIIECLVNLIQKL